MDPREPVSDALGGELGSVSDVEWRDAHERLVADLGGLVPPEQLAYTWEPGAPGPVPEERELAPRAGEWDPGAVDDRFDGGGFRG